MNDQELGLPQAVDAVQRLREQLGARTVTVEIDTPQGAVSILCDDRGLHVYVAGSAQ